MPAKLPEFDPRLWQKNFAMPMAPVPVSDPVFRQPLRKEDVPGIPGLLRPGTSGRNPQPPTFGPIDRAREPAPTVAIRPRSEAGAATLPPLYLARVSGSVFRVVPGKVNNVGVEWSGSLITDLTQIPFSGLSYVFAKVVGTFGGTDTFETEIVLSDQTTYPDGYQITETGFVGTYPLGDVAANGTVTNYTNGGDLGSQCFGNVIMWWKW